MTNRLDNPIPIQWSSLSLPQKNHLINVLATLVQSQMTNPLPVTGGGNEHCDNQPAAESLEPKREDHTTSSGSKSGDLCPSIDPATGSSPPRVHTPPIRFG
jgi:hypothetical protein